MVSPNAHEVVMNEHLQFLKRLLLNISFFHYLQDICKTEN